jgi:Holliday junction resolvase RusA-like endonuclease
MNVVMRLDRRRSYRNHTTRMPKPSQKLKFRLPEYVSPRNTWRRKIYTAALEVVNKLGVSYPEDAKLAVEVKLYLRGRALEIHDVDNRLKDILDALQGRMGGSEAIRKFVPIIRNDRQVFSVVITKSSPPQQSHGLGHVLVKLVD